MDQAIRSLVKNIDGIDENMEIDIPFLGKQKISELTKYLPLYLRLRKDLRGIIPKEYDDIIMKYAETHGYIEPKPQQLVDLDIPLKELEEHIETLWQQGYSTLQIAKILNVNGMVVSSYFTKKRQEEEEKENESIYTSKNKIVSWLKRKLHL